MNHAHILIIEDEGIVARDLACQLQHLGHSVVATVRSGKEAVAKAGELSPDLVLMDIHLQGDMDGIDTASEIRVRYAVPVVYLTA